jgi:hypothetical protein
VWAKPLGLRSWISRSHRVMLTLGLATIQTNLAEYGLVMQWYGQHPHYPRGCMCRGSLHRLRLIVHIPRLRATLACAILLRHNPNTGTFCLAMPPLTRRQRPNVGAIQMKPSVVFGGVWLFLIRLCVLASSRRNTYLELDNGDLLWQSLSQSSFLISFSHRVFYLSIKSSPFP